MSSRRCLVACTLEGPIECQEVIGKTSWKASAGHQWRSELLVSSLASQLGAWKGLLTFQCFGKLLLQKELDFHGLKDML